MINKKGNKFELLSKDDTKKLSKPDTLAKIKKREREVNFFKHLRTKLKKQE